MDRITQSAKTLEEAIKLAVISLDTPEDQIEYTIVEEGSKGFLGFGSKDVVIEAKRKSSVLSAAKKFLTELLTNMDQEFQLSIEDGDEIDIEIMSNNMALLIGKHGQTLDAIQYLTNLASNKGFEKFKRINIDIEGYKKRRRESLETLASKLAQRVRKSKKSIVLESMNSNERRIIHTYLKKEMNVNTRSEGREPDRRVVIYFDGR